MKSFTILSAALFAIAGCSFSQEDIPQADQQPFDFVITFMAPVDEISIASLISFATRAVAANAPNLVINFETTGGSVSNAMAAYEFLSSLPESTNVITCNLSRISSSGIYIFAAGDERYCARSANFMFHQARYEVSGNSASAEAYLKEVRRQRPYLEEILQRAMKPGDHKFEFFGDDNYLDAERAKEIGFVTKLGLPNIDNLNFHPQTIFIITS